MTVIREGYSEEMLKVVFEHVASGSCTTCCDTCSNDYYGVGRLLLLEMY